MVIDIYSLKTPSQNVFLSSVQKRFQVHTRLTMNVLILLQSTLVCNVFTLEHSIPSLLKSNLLSYSNHPWPKMKQLSTYCWLESDNNLSFPTIDRFAMLASMSSGKVISSCFLSGLLLFFKGDIGGVDKSITSIAAAGFCGIIIH